MLNSSKTKNKLKKKKKALFPEAGSKELPVPWLNLWVPLPAASSTARPGRRSPHHTENKAREPATRPRRAAAPRPSPSPVLPHLHCPPLRPCAHPPPARHPAPSRVPHRGRTDTQTRTRSSPSGFPASPPSPPSPRHRRARPAGPAPSPRVAGPTRLPSAPGLARPGGGDGEPGGGQLSPPRDRTRSGATGAATPRRGSGRRRPPPPPTPGGRGAPLGQAGTRGLPARERGPSAPRWLPHPPSRPPPPQPPGPAARAPPGTCAGRGWR